MKLGRLIWLWPAVLAAQSAIPVFIGRPITLLPAAVDGAGQKVAFGAAITPDGATLAITDIYLTAQDGAGLRRLTRLAGDPRPPQGASAVAISADGSRVALTALLGPSIEEVHVVDVATGADRTVAVDKEGCIQPLCANCFFHCVNTPHLTADGAKVLYSVRRQQPFFLVNADGTGLTRLPVFSGGLAPGPQRVISKNGQIVFTSSAPAGPNFAATATDVYLCNLDGTNVRPVTKFGNDPSVFAFNAAISADGNTIAFEKDSQVWVVRADGTGLRSLASGATPSISGDGSLAAFVQGGQIYLVRADGTGLRALTSFKMSAAFEPVISDDGSRVVLSIGPRDGQRGALYAVDADGKNLRPVYAPRALNQGGVSGLIDFSPPSPGSLFTAYGQNLAPDTVTAATRFPLPETLAGVSLLVNGRPAPLVAVTPWQVNAQLPPEVSEGPAAFQFRFADGAMPAAGAADVRAFAPAIFFALLPGGGCQGAALHGHTAVVADKDKPAEAGETLEIYGTGLGPAEPFVPAGVAAPSAPPARVFPPEVQIGGRRAQVTFAGLAPGFAGVYQVNAVVPSGLRPGPQGVAWRAGTTNSTGCATIWTR
ncbi:MAG: hypothetical protein HY238_06020 [Acidobacteria bacterium]|nr:hypothetical protein [Acidobacteriota bacterium]